MKVKIEYLAILVAILMLSLYLIFRTSDRSHYELPSLPEIAGTELTKIEIAKADSSVVLTRGGDEWQITPQGYPADAEKVKKMLDVVGRLTLTALVSESKNYERYGLDDEERINVKAWARGEIRREFAVGKAAGSHRHTFVTIGGDARVYHARGNLRSTFDQTVDDLRQKIVLSFEKAEIQEVQITRGDRSMVIARKEAPAEVSASQEPKGQGPSKTQEQVVWVTADGQRGDESKLNRLIGTLSNLRCEKYIEGRSKGEFQDPIYTVLLKGVKDYRLSIFPKIREDAKNHPAISSENDYPFLLSDWQAKAIMRDPGEMLAKPKDS